MKIFLILCLALNALAASTGRGGNAPKQWRQTASANVHFAHNLYAEVARHTAMSENLLISPYAVSAGLSMILLGAGGNTADQLVETLEYTTIDNARATGADSHEDIARMYKKMKDQLMGKDHGFTLKAPNRIFIDEHETYESNFVSSCSKYFGAENEVVNFKERPGEAVEKINEFVSEATEGTITEAVTSDAINPETEIVFVSTLFFQGDWVTPFSPDTTFNRDFQLFDGTTVKHPFMQREFLMMKTSDYIRPDTEGCLDAMVLQLPYITTSDKYKVVMEFILPMERGEASLREIEAALSEDTMVNTKQKSYEASVTLHLPKLAMSYAADISEHLIAMGITDLFESGSADLSAINGKSNLHFSSAQHKTFLKMNEKGTTASASFSAASTRMANDYMLDRPFLFILREAYTKMPLFMGRVVDPSK